MGHNLADLPDKCLIEVFVKTDSVLTVINCLGVCKRFRSLIQSSDQDIFQRLLATISSHIYREKLVKDKLDSPFDIGPWFQQALRLTIVKRAVTRKYGIPIPNYRQAASEEYAKNDTKQFGRPDVVIGAGSDIEVIEHGDQQMRQWQYVVVAGTLVALDLESNKFMCFDDEHKKWTWKEEKGEEVLVYYKFPHEDNARKFHFKKSDQQGATFTWQITSHGHVHGIYTYQDTVLNVQRASVSNKEPDYIWDEPKLESASLLLAAENVVANISIDRDYGYIRDSRVKSSRAAGIVDKVLGTRFGVPLTGDCYGLSDSHLHYINRHENEYWTVPLDRIVDTPHDIELAWDQIAILPSAAAQWQFGAVGRRFIAIGTQNGSDAMFIDQYTPAKPVGYYNISKDAGLWCVNVDGKVAHLTKSYLESLVAECKLPDYHHGAVDLS